MLSRINKIKGLNVKYFSKVSKCVVDNPYTLQVNIVNADFCRSTLCQC